MVTANPFAEIIERLDGINAILIDLTSKGPTPTTELITRKELQKRLGVTEPTIIRMEKQKKIRAIRMGSRVMYNWPKVLEELERDEN